MSSPDCCDRRPARCAFSGRDIAGVGPVELARLGMSRTFQLVNIFPALTVRETLGGCGRVPLAPCGQSVSLVEAR
jgi:ABC-type branched-subunit amino acid transport system ATPase component